MVFNCPFKVQALLISGASMVCTVFIGSQEGNYLLYIYVYIYIVISTSIHYPVRLFQKMILERNNVEHEAKHLDIEKNVKIDLN